MILHTVAIYVYRNISKYKSNVYRLNYPCYLSLNLQENSMSQ